jgi:predicted DNA-binding WGR domain protein
MQARRFEFLGGSSAKFWEVSVEGRELTVCFGRIGTDGQSKTKAFANEKAAQAEAEKLIREKAGKGYKEVARTDDDGEEARLTADQWWQRFEQSGWTDDVPPKELARIKTAFKKLKGNVADAYDILSVHGYDAECIENDGDYSKWIIPAYRDASHGVLAATKIKDKLDVDVDEGTGTATVSFEVRGKKFSRDLEQDSDYVADDFHPFMNSVLAKLGDKRRFFILSAGDQIARLVCVTPATYKSAQRLGVVPPGGDDDDF